MRKGLLLTVMLAVCAIVLCACGKHGQDAEDRETFLIRGWYIEGKDQALLITDPEYCKMYTTAAPIAITEAGDGDFSLLEDGDVIEIEVETVLETWPCQATVYGFNFIEHSDRTAIDTNVMEQLREYGWID